MSRSLKDKVGLVTGGSSGIGRTCALAFAKEGAKVIVADVMIESGEETVEMIKQTGGEGFFVKTDVTKANEVESLISTAVSAYGRLDFAHNNAGILGNRASTADCSEENWDQVISINLKGVWLCMKYEIIQMLKQGKGSIVNTASVAGIIGQQVMPAYVASKHGVNGLTRAAALEYAKLGIRVNSVCPGIIRAGIAGRAVKDNPKAEAERNLLQPIGRLGEPEEVAEAVIWLCSDAASLVTGHALPVDGGWAISDGWKQM